MPYPFPPDLDQLVKERMASGIYDSEEDLIRCALLALEHEEEDVRAIEQAIQEWQSGDAGIPLDEAFAAIRARHGISTES